MPHNEKNDSQHNGRKLKDAVETLMRLRIATDALGRLRHAKYCPCVNQEAGRGGEGEEGLEAADTGGVSGPVGEGGDAAFVLGEEGEEEDEEGGVADDLKREAGEQNVVRGGGILAVALGDADEGRAGDLHDGGDDVAADEDADNGFAREMQEALCFPAEDLHHGSQDGVVAGGEEDWGDDDEEVLDYEVDCFVGLADGGRGRLDAEDVADQFEDNTD